MNDKIFKLKYLGFLGVLGAFNNPSLRYFYLFFLLALVQILCTGKVDLKNSNTRNYFRTLALSQLNIPMASKAVLQALGQIVIFLRNLKGFPNRDNYQNIVSYRLPFNGVWTVVNGGSVQTNSHSWNIFTQRYAYDLVITSANKSFSNDRLSLDDYYCFKQEVVAPADGIVIQVKHDIKDFTEVGELKIDWKVKDFRGNFVIIMHHPNEYSFTAHLLEHSVTVRKGDRVAKGQLIGLCGNSGHSTEPHIHFHLQDSSNMWIATGLPIRFEEFKCENEERSGVVKRKSYIEKGDRVAPMDPGDLHSPSWPG